MMAQEPAKKPQGHSPSHPEPNTVGWYFFEFWPIMVFGTCFVLMMALPLTMSEGFAAGDVFSSSDFVWAPYGILIIAAFLLGWLITFVVPRLMGAYIFCLAVYALILTENVTAMNWGWTLAILFLGFVVFGGIYMLKVKDEPKK